MLAPLPKNKVSHPNFCIANPLFGSTQSHFAALLALMGNESFIDFLEKLKRNEVKIVASNSMVRDLVVAGECFFGLTDTDDAYDAIKEKKPIKIILPDQDSIGTFFFPNTVMLINGSKHEKEAKLLIEYLLSSEVEKRLAELALQIPLKRSSKVDIELIERLRNGKYYNLTFQEIFENLEDSQKLIKEHLL